MPFLKLNNNMISFIIIGRNEGWKLTKCLQSIYDTINYNKLINYEVIYVDSASTDDSIDRAKKFNEVNIFLITGEYNAAIARNIGAKEAKGDVFFFIDGDMEIIPDFLPLVYNEKIGLKFNFVSGQIIDIFFNYNDEYIGENIRIKNLNKDKFFNTTGGIFLIKKDIWNSVNGMNNKYKRSQDIDLALRLSKKGVKILRKKELIAKHNTIHYMNKKRMWKMLFNKNQLYGRSLLYREHLSNKFIYPLIIKQDFSAIILVISFIFSLILNSFYLLSIYLLAIIYRSIKNTNKQNNFFELIAYYILRDIFVILGFLFFHPKKFSESEIIYQIIKKNN